MTWFEMILIRLAVMHCKQCFEANQMWYSSLNLSYAGCYGAFTEIPPVRTDLFPGSTLRLNCASDIASPVAWFVNDTSNTRRTVFRNNAIASAYVALFNIVRSNGYHLVGRTTADSSYCGLYQCVEDNGFSSSAAEATVSGISICACFSRFIKQQK